MSTRRNQTPQQPDTVNAPDWDSEIPVDVGGGEFETMEDGTECGFTVHKITKDRSAAGNPMAKLELICTADDGRRNYIYENVTLVAAALFRVRAFGVAIGHIAPDAPGKINWDAVEGATGRCTLKVEEWKKRDNSVQEQNKVKDWLAPEQAAPQADGEVDFT